MVYSNKNKYNAKKITIDGETFDSEKEFVRWQQLRMMQTAGKVRNLRRQVKFVVIPEQKGERECSYIADFVYFDTDKHETVVEDVKGYRKGAAYNIFVIKRKLMLREHGLRVQEV